jgi:hypothetical protein
VDSLDIPPKSLDGCWIGGSASGGGAPCGGCGVLTGGSAGGGGAPSGVGGISTGGCGVSTGGCGNGRHESSADSTKA